MEAKPKDERLIEAIDAATSEWQSIVDSWHVEDHKLVIEAIRDRDLHDIHE